MKAILIITASLSLMSFISWNSHSGSRQTSLLLKADTLFPKGVKNSNKNFRGEVWVHSLIQQDSLNRIEVGNVTFAPGARSNWHLHPAGQILLVTDGKGYYQEKGSPKKILRKGDVIKCPPNVAHWHGASKDSGFVQLAITGREKGATVWMQEVTEEEYNSEVKP
jgi:quercetin dioxygenase-like cupin family protein